MVEQHRQGENAASGTEIDAALSICRTDEARKQKRIEREPVPLFGLEQAPGEAAAALPDVGGEKFGHGDL